MSFMRSVHLIQSLRSLSQQRGLVIFAKSSHTTEKERIEEQTSKMSFNQQTPPTIILLKGDTSQGRGQLISNINACLAIQDTVRTTVFLPIPYFLTVAQLGPLGADKLMVDSRGTQDIHSLVNEHRGSDDFE